MTLSSAPFGAGSGWVGWAIVALVVIAFWTLTIAATLALFPTRHHNRGQRGPRGD